MSGAGLRGATPLILAAQRGHTGVAELLISADADVNARDERAPWFDVGTVLHYAAEAGHTDVAELLIDNGADVTLEVGDAATAGDKRLRSMLLFHGTEERGLELTRYDEKA